MLSRSPSDLLRLVVAAIVLLAFVAIGLLFGESVVGFAADLYRGLDRLPSGLITVIAVVAQFAGAVLIGLAVVVAVRSRTWQLAAAVATGVVLACGLTWLFRDLIDVE